MTDQTWTALGAVDPLALVDARLQAHQALQWLARAAYANVESMPGDSHANLGWSDVYGALMTRAMRDDVALGLRLRDLTLFVERDGAVTTAFGLDTAQNEDAGHWIGEELGRLGLKAPDPGLPYGDDLPPRVTGHEGTYNVADISPHLSELSQWFANAAHALQAIHDENAGLRPGPSEVRCWPHHFDIATLISLDGGDAEEARSIGVGLSPGDGTYDEPYFYVSPWPYPDVDALPALPGIGAWNTDGFVAAVATGSEVATAPDQGAAALQFLQVAVNACKNALGA